MIDLNLSIPANLSVRLAIAALIFVATLIAPAAADDPPEWQQIWDLPDENLVGDFNIVSGDDGYLYYGEYQIGIKRLDPATGTITTLSSSIKVLDFDVQGDYLYTIEEALDGTSQIAIRRKSDAELVATIEPEVPFTNPHHISVDRTGNIFVDDWSNPRILQFYWSGTGVTFVREFDGTGSADGKMSSPTSIAQYSPDGSSAKYVVVLDLMNHKIRIFDENGIQVRSWGSEGTGPGQFNYAYDLAVDQVGNIYMADYTNNDHARVQKFSLTGTLLTTFGSFGTGNGQLWYPSTLDIDSQGNVYVGDSHYESLCVLHNRIQKFSAPVRYEASFAMSPSPAGCGQTVTFTDTSNCGPTSWQWSFGDGATSTLQHPTHVYTSGSTYTVTLQATRGVQTYTHSKTLTVVNPSGPVTAAFTSSPASPKVGTSIQFTDTSTGYPSGWTWQFGDGGTATNQNPVHMYTAAGTYTVRLTITRTGAASSTTTRTVTVAAPTKPTAAFSFSPANPKTGTNVQFTDTSTGEPTGYYWDFGDGATSNAFTPIHQYSAVGTYTVTHMVMNAAGSASTTKKVTVTAAVSPVLVPGGAGAPRDLNGDGKYEDLNGNGRKDFADVTLFFAQMTWIGANEPLAAFDYNGNGRIDFADVTWLFTRL
jgi:PKD repeat protein